MNYYVVEEGIVEHRPLSEKHRAERLRLNDLLIGHLTVEVEASPEVAPLVAKIGPPPSWYRTGGTTLAQVNAVGAVAKMRRAT